MTQIAPDKLLPHVSPVEPTSTSIPTVILDVPTPMHKRMESDNSASISSRRRTRRILQSIIGWIGVVAISFLAGWYFGGTRATQNSLITLREELPGSQDSSTAIPVTVEPIMQRSVARTVSAVGSLNAFEEVMVSPKLEGRVQRIVADVSTRIKPGDVLLELDATDARLAVQQAERSLQAELAKWGFQGVPDEDVDLSQLPSVRSAKAKYELSKARFERMQSLKTTGSVSDDDFDQARTDVGVLENEWRKEQLLAQSSAAVARLRAADLAIAQQRLNDCQVRAPIPSINDPEHEAEYVVSERLVSEGSLLRPGTEVFRLVFGRTLKLRLSVPETYATSVEVGQRVDVFPSSIEKPLSGKVAKVSPAVDRATRTFMVEVYVSNSAGTLKPGGFAKASIRIAESEQAVTVPMSSVYSLAGVQKIFVIQNGMANEYVVSIGEQGKEWVEISSPSIPVGAMVVTSGQRLLSDGVPVKVRSAEPKNDEPAATQTEVSNPS